MKRFNGNPILRQISEHAWEARAVFNAAAVYVGDGFTFCIVPLVMTGFLDLAMHLRQMVITSKNEYRLPFLSQRTSLRNMVVKILV